MSLRATPLVTSEVYHLYNRSVAHQPIFTNIKDLQRFLEVIDFYRFKNPPMRYSHYRRLGKEQKQMVLESLYKRGEQLIEIFTFSIMPNHFHLLVKQTQDSGIKIFASQIQNSYAKYYNTKYQRVGSLFQEMFKAGLIETDEQFIHVARYIHLNPLTNYILRNIEELDRYSWSSFTDYMGYRSLPFLNKKTLLSYFATQKKFREFNNDQVHYQRTLETIRHLTLE